MDITDCQSIQMDFRQISLILIFGTIQLIRNYFKLLDVLGELGQDVSEFKEEIAPNPKKSFFKLHFEKFSLDFLPEIKGLGKFTSSFEVRDIVTLQNVEVSYLSLPDLIKNKQETLREKDIIDIRN